MPGSGEGLDETVLVWNGTVSRLPALAVVPATVQELVAAVGFARDHGLLVRLGATEEGRRAAPPAERTVTLDLSRLGDLPRRSGRDARPPG